MTYSIRLALVALPLGLMHSGCAGPHRTETAHHRASPPSTRAAAPPTAAMVVDRSDEPRGDSPVASTAAEPQHDITLEQIHGHVQDRTAVVIDARSAEHFASGHVRGAINVPAGEVESHMPDLEQTIGPDELIIIYCGSASCGSGDMVYEALAARGFTNMRVYKPGWQMLASARDLR